MVIYIPSLYIYISPGDIPPPYIYIFSGDMSPQYTWNIDNANVLLLYDFNKLSDF